MAYTGDQVWGLTRDEIVDGALRKLGEYDEGDTVPAGERTSAQIALNAMIREWSEIDNVGLWMEERCFLILNRGVQRYKLGPAGTPGTDDDFHAFLDTELIEGTGTAIEPAAETVIAVDVWVDYAGNATATPAANDVVGVRLADLSIHWTTVASATSSSVTLNTGLPSATTASAKVYTYTNRLPRPADIFYIYRESTSRNAAEVDMIGREQFERLSLKTNTGVPTSAFYDRSLHPTTPADDFPSCMFGRSRTVLTTTSWCLSPSSTPMRSRRTRTTRAFPVSGRMH